MPIKLIPAGEEVHLRLTGEIALFDLEQLKTGLIKALDSASRVVIDTQNLSHIDVACLQLLCSAYQSALSGGKELTISARPSKAFSRQVVRSGLAQRHFLGDGGEPDFLAISGSEKIRARKEQL